MIDFSMPFLTFWSIEQSVVHFIRKMPMSKIVLKGNKNISGRSRFLHSIHHSDLHSRNVVQTLEIGDFGMQWFFGDFYYWNWRYISRLHDLGWKFHMHCNILGLFEEITNFSRSSQLYIECLMKLSLFNGVTFIGDFKCHE